MAMVFLLVGALGFLPGVTADYSSMTFAGRDSMAMLLGIFQVSVLHNLMHMALGITGLVLARTALKSVGFLLAGGLVYIALAMYGIVIDSQSAANFVPVNGADNWLHLTLGVVTFTLGSVLVGSAGSRTAGTAK